MIFIRKFTHHLDGLINLPEKEDKQSKHAADWKQAKLLSDATCGTDIGNIHPILNLSSGIFRKVSW